MVASRDIEAGELVFKEEPLAFGPNHTALPCCLDCMKSLGKEDTYVCPECGLPVCEEMCAYGEEHQKECQIFSKVEPRLKVEDFSTPSPIYWCITAIRLLVLRETDPIKYGIVTRMMDHNEEHAAKKSNWKLYKENVVDFLRERCGLAERFSEEEIFHVLGVLDVNSVRVNANIPGGSNAGGSSAGGHALYPMTALMSHSCVANTKTVLQPDFTCETWTTLPIPKGEEITKQYINPMETTAMRRSKLKSGWYFDCICQRCSDPTENEAYVSATRCLRCQNGIIAPQRPLEGDSSEWLCDLCPHSSNGTAVNKLNEYFLSKIEMPEVFMSVDAMEQLLEKASKLFHSNHYILTLLRVKLNAAYNRLASKMIEDQEEADREAGLEPKFRQIPTEVYMRRKELLDDVQRVIDLVEPGLTRRRGLSLFETSTCHLQLGKQLWEAKRFSKTDFLLLLNSEITALKECVKCLQNSKEDSQESHTQYRAEGAIHEAECMVRILTTDGAPDDDVPELVPTPPEKNESGADAKEQPV